MNKFARKGYSILRTCIALLSLALLLGCFAGCAGEGEPTDVTTVAPSAPSTDAPTDAPSEAPTDAETDAVGTDEPTEEPTEEPVEG